MDTARYEVVAHIPADVSRPQFQVMQQRLLADRFGLRVHREKQEMSIYALTVGNTGPGLVKTKDPIRDKPFATWVPPFNGPPVRAKARVVRKEIPWQTWRGFFRTR